MPRRFSKKTKYFFIAVVLIALIGFCLSLLVWFGLIKFTPPTKNVFLEEESIAFFSCESKEIRDGKEEKLAVTINKVIDSDQKNYEKLLNYFREKYPDLNSNYQKLKVFYYFVKKGEVQEAGIEIGKKIKCSKELLEEGKADLLDYAVLFAGLAQASGLESAVFVVDGYFGKGLYVMPGVKVDESTPEIGNLGGNYYFTDKEGNRYLLIAPFDHYYTINDEGERHKFISPFQKCILSCKPKEKKTAVIFKVE